MATRLYFGSVDGANAVSPAFDAGWEQTGQATRRKLYFKNNTPTINALADKTVTVPITTSQDILAVQFVSDPIPPQLIAADGVANGLLSLVLRCVESATTANATLCFILKIVSQDGTTITGTPFSVFDTQAEFGTTAATRIRDGATLTQVITKPGDRIVIEVGVHASSPTAATTATIRFGFSAASDFALTTGLTTDLNPWAQFDDLNILSPMSNNFQFIKAGDGISVSEKVR